MHNTLRRLWASIFPIVGIIIFVTLFIIGIFIFSYLLIVAAIFGLILFCVAYIRAKIAARHKSPTSPSQGRIIDHEDQNKNN